MLEHKEEKFYFFFKFITYRYSFMSLWVVNSALSFPLVNKFQKKKIIIVIPGYLMA